MKVLILFIISIAAGLAIPAADFSSEELKMYPRFIEVPDGDGNPHQIDLNEEPDHELLDEITRNPANNNYLLYTRHNLSPQTLHMDDVYSIVFSNFNPDWPIIVVAHGWLSNQKSSLNPVIRDAYLDRMDANVIIIEWRRLAMSNYITAVRGVPAVGKGLGKFLKFLHKVTGAPYENMHLIGFSLGSHLVGNAGRETGGRVGRITALDPAGPLWNTNSKRINPDDAQYVEGIHTDGGYTIGGLGIGKPIGDADFFPNGGVSQPGCLTNICNHNRAWEFFAASVTYDHLVGLRCNSNLQVTLNTCRGPALKMGNSDLNKRGSGMYRVNTARRYPY
ncbi:hypothetical protein O0L34_g15449 [Tuta absoluta]|nr:hypothetical protein O0L34_g15449 [Tuta absoluta]